MPTRQVREAIDAMAEAASKEARTLGDAFVGGEANDAHYVVGVKSLIKQGIAAAVAAGAGGWPQTTAADWSGAGTRAKALYAELERMVGEYHRDEITGPQLAARVAGLPLMARAAYEAVKAGRDAAAGLAFERRFLGSGNHCAGCIEEAAKGWVPTGELLPLGECECGGRCLCSVERRTTVGDE